LPTEFYTRSMSLIESVNAVTDLSAWKERIKRELKAPLKPEDLQWEVSEYFQLDPVYDSTSLGQEHAYLADFHNEWKNQKPGYKPEFLISGRPFQDAAPDLVKTAEEYGFTGWETNGPDSRFSLPAQFRAFGQKNLLNSTECSFDPIMDSLRTGTWVSGFGKETVKPANGAFHIHGVDVHNAGGSAVQELAFSLLVAEQYRHQISPEEFIGTAGQWVFHLGTGPLFWLELAKLRAMRLLWMNFCFANEAGRPAGTIQAETSGLYWSASDPDSNLIRHTSEVMSSILGGADRILIHPHTFDQAMVLDAGRLAVNIGLLALEESRLNTHFDPTSGSYLVEILTHKLAEAAWKQFSEWNELPFSEFIEQGTFQDLVKKRSEQLKEKYAAGDLVLIGANKHQSPMAKKSPPFMGLPAVKASSDFPILTPVFLDA